MDIREDSTACDSDLIEELVDYRNMKIRSKDIDELTKILVRYTIGFGLIEVLLQDERVQDITVDDVTRDGVKDVDNEIRNQDQTTHESIRNWNLAWAQFQFQTLWDSLNAKRGYGWDINPWVWVIEFERVDKPEGERDVG